MLARGTSSHEFTSQRNHSRIWVLVSLTSGFVSFTKHFAAKCIAAIEFILVATEQKLTKMELELGGIYYSNSWLMTKANSVDKFRQELST